MDASDFRLQINGRPFRVKVDRSFTSCDNEWCPVDVIDTRTTFSAQAIIERSIAEQPWRLIRESQFRDAIKSAYGNATHYETGTYTTPPDDFPIGFRGQVIGIYMRTLNDRNGNPRRGWDVHVIDHNSTVMYLGFIDEGYGGNGAHNPFRQAHPDGIEIGWYEVQPKLYNQLMKREAH